MGRYDLLAEVWYRMFKTHHCNLSRVHTIGFLRLLVWDSLESCWAGGRRGAFAAYRCSGPISENDPFQNGWSNDTKCISRILLNSIASSWFHNDWLSWQIVRRPRQPPQYQRTRSIKHYWHKYKGEVPCLCFLFCYLCNYTWSLRKFWDTKASLVKETGSEE